MKKINLTGRQITFSLHVLFWVTVFLLPWWLGSPGKPYRLIGSIPMPFYLISGWLCLILFYGNAFFLYPRLVNRKWWWLYLLCFAAVIVAVNHFKIVLLVRWFPEVKIFGSNAPFIFAPTVFAMVISAIYRFVSNRLLVEKLRREKEAEQLSMELKFLRSQVNPHFLFNVLTNLVSLARKKSDRLEPSLITLSELVRYMLYDTNEKKVTLGKEVEYLKNYIALQRLRFDADVIIETIFDLKEDADKCKIEPMLLIPFVENAFKHGMGWIKDPQIQIRLTAGREKLVLNVENKFSPADRQHKDATSGIGLKNVQYRLNLLYPGRHRLSIVEKDNIFQIQLTLEL